MQTKKEKKEELLKKQTEVLIFKIAPTGKINISNTKRKNVPWGKINKIKHLSM